jgi:hypothetical protein
VKVFLIQDQIAYEGDFAVAVFSTAEKADDFISRAKNYRYGETVFSRYDSLAITEFEVDAEP